MASTNNITQERITAVRKKLPEWEVEGLLITSPSNRRWLSGFTGSTAYLIVTAERALLGTDFRYWNRIAREAPDFELVKMEGGIEARTAAFLNEAGVSSLGVEGEMTLSELAMLEGLEGVSIEFKVLEETVEPLRSSKTAEEIEAIRAAAAITDLAMSAVNEIVRPGMSEKEIAWELEKIMREAGADGLAFTTIVASGPNAANAHHDNSNRKVEAGDPIIVDMGAKLDGYNSDLTRTFYLGDTPSEQFWTIYHLVHEAQKAALAEIRAGVQGTAVDKAARDIINNAGYEKNFGHGLGHSLGLDIHEDPRLSPLFKDKAPLPAGAVLTVEPGIYIEGWGGVRIEDLVLVTDSGFEFLSHSSKNPIIPT